VASGKVLRPRKAPCPSCPYRRDCPSAIWDASEYEKLAAFDGPTGEQAEAGAFAAFFCHTTPARLCSGWCGCHDMDENLGLRITASALRASIDPSVYSYVSPVPLFTSGAEAAEHGMRDIAGPSDEAVAAVVKLIRSGRVKEAG
jgi:hypothetical protein